jgi:hypothetical protein
MRLRLGSILIPFVAAAGPVAGRRVQQVTLDTDH